MNRRDLTSLTGRGDYIQPSIPPIKLKSGALHILGYLLALMPAAWLLGGLSGLTFPITATLGWVTGLSFLFAGALVAADRDLSLPVVATLVAIIGAINGFVTGAGFSQTRSAALALTGTLVALIIVVTLVTGLVVSLKAFWERIAVRVMGSWIAAMGLLMIGWSLRAGK